ncbi:sugar ABC transporter permease [Dehalococcoidia bacterium]|nr:sugar ABC transporter permease [Dehalococcoidia bacterium]
MRNIHRLPFPFLLILPSIVFFLILFAFPLVQGVGLAFTTREGALTLANFGRMFGEIHFRDAVVYTFLLTTIIVPIQLVLALIIALLVNTRLFGSSKFLYICAIPIAISEIAAGIIWLSIFTGSGYLNILLFRLGLIENRITFLGLETPEYLFLAIVLCEVWRATAIVTIIVVAGLQMIHKDYMDVADVYGASTLQKLRHVTLPLLKPCIKTALIIRTVLAFQVFGTVLALAGRMVPVLAGEAYMAQFFLRDVHLASTYGLLIMAFSTAFVLLYLRLLRTRWTI